MKAASVLREKGAEENRSFVARETAILCPAMDTRLGTWEDRAVDTRCKTELTVLWESGGERKFPAWSGNALDGDYWWEQLLIHNRDCVALKERVNESRVTEGIYPFGACAENRALYDAINWALKFEYRMGSGRFSQPIKEGEELAPCERCETYMGEGLNLSREWMDAVNDCVKKRKEKRKKKEALAAKRKKAEAKLYIGGSKYESPNRFNVLK